MNGLRSCRLLILPITLLSIGLASPLAGQEREVNGRVADSSAGRVGQRQTKVLPGIAENPNFRIAGRIQNRVQNRIRNRIDRYYDPQANTTSPFVVAAEQARLARRGVAR